MMIQAAALGLGTVWKHVAPEKAPQVAKVLGLPEDYILVNLLPLGYPKKSMTPHGDKDFSPNKIHFGKW